MTKAKDQIRIKIVFEIMELKVIIPQLSHFFRQSNRKNGQKLGGHKKYHSLCPNFV